MTEEERSALKSAIIDEIRRNDGFKTIAVKTIGVPFSTFYDWLQRDPDFKDAVDAAVAACRDYRDDLAEQKLLENVKAGDTASVIFYNKTRNKNRGYTERALPVEQPKQPTLPVLEGKEWKKRVKAQKDYIVRVLKEEGKYTSELTFMATFTAQLVVKRNMLLESGYSPISVEISREGNTRESISAAETMFNTLTKQLQQAYTALGLTTDSKERRGDGKDSLQEFLQSMEE